MTEGKKIIFLTGATGLLGSYLLKLFLEQGHEVYCLARGRKEKSAQQRITDLLRFWDGCPGPESVKNLKVIEGDITLPSLGIKDKKTYEALAEKIEVIYHSAALAELKSPLEKIRKINVGGTKNVFDFALRCISDGALRKVNHVSTAYVVGDKDGIEFTEEMLDVGQSFHNTYEQSKYEAELLVNNYVEREGLPVAIFRPSMVMGESRQGKTTNFRLIYEPLHFFSQGIYEAFPADIESIQNLVCLDPVAQALYALGLGDGLGTYHLVSPNNSNVGSFLKFAADYFGFHLPELIPARRFDFRRWSPVQRILAEPFIPYFNYRTVFKNTREEENAVFFPGMDNAILSRIFEYCVKTGHMKK